MNNGTQNTQAVLARQEELVVQEMPDEVLVYDLKRHKAHCLNKTAAFVWQHCDGQTTVAEMAGLLEKETGARVDEDVVWYALGKLGDANLLANKVALPVTDGMSRRRMVRRLGTMLVLPAVVSLIAPNAVQAVTVVTLNEKIACGQCNNQDNPVGCTTDTCCTGSCGGPNRSCFPTGLPGSTPGQIDTACSGFLCEPASNAAPCS
jgi:hypothetical protein